MDKVTRQCPQTTTFLKRKESRSGINRGPSAYQPNALPLCQTGSLGERGLYPRPSAIVCDTDCRAGYQEFPEATTECSALAHHTYIFSQVKVCSSAHSKQQTKQQQRKTITTKQRRKKKKKREREREKEAKNNNLKARKKLGEKREKKTKTKKQKQKKQKNGGRERVYKKFNKQKCNLQSLSKFSGFNLNLFFPFLYIIFLSFSPFFFHLFF